MHGNIALSVSPKSKKDAKRRKLGWRPPARSGRKPKPSVCYLDAPVLPPPSLGASVATQPHRVGLPERFRLDERAGTVLGALLLTGRLAAHDGDGKLSGRAQALYEAGQRYARIVSRYRAMIGAPLPGSGVGPGAEYTCLGTIPCGLDDRGKRIHPCECMNRTVDYNGAHDALICAGRLVLMTVNRVAVHGDPCLAWQMPALIIGLGTLASEFGLRA